MHAQNYLQLAHDFAQPTTTTPSEVLLQPRIIAKLRKTTFWTNSLKFTTTHCETVNQLPHSSTRTETTTAPFRVRACLTFTAFADRHKFPGSRPTTFHIVTASTPATLRLLSLLSFRVKTLQRNSHQLPPALVSPCMFWFNCFVPCPLTYDFETDKRNMSFLDQFLSCFVPCSKQTNWLQDDLTQDSSDLLRSPHIVPLLRSGLRCRTAFYDTLHRVSSAPVRSPSDPACLRRHSRKTQVQQVLVVVVR